MALNRKDIRTAERGVDLQHRHFAFIAAALKATKPAPGSVAMCTWFDVVDRFASECRATNPRFNRERFLSACGIE